MKGDAIRGHLDGLVLSVLSESPAHGYEVIVRLRERSSGAFDLAEGTVYPVLHRLEADGLLTATNSAVQGRRRKTYHLSTDGRGALTERRAEWRRFCTVMNDLMGAPA